MFGVQCLLPSARHRSPRAAGAISQPTCPMGWLAYGFSTSPSCPGVVLVKGFSGLHPTAQVESTAQAPYPVAGDIAIDGVWLGAAPNQSNFVDQRYDSRTASSPRGSRTGARDDSRSGGSDVLQPEAPTLVLQEIAVTVHAGAQLSLRAIVDIGKVSGRVAQRKVGSFGRPRRRRMAPWRGSPWAVSRSAVSPTSRNSSGTADVVPQVRDWGQESGLSTEVVLDARPGKRYRLRQIASLVPSSMHSDPTTRRRDWSAVQQRAGLMRCAARTESSGTNIGRDACSSRPTTPVGSSSLTRPSSTSTHQSILLRRRARRSTAWPNGTTTTITTAT